MRATFLTRRVTRALGALTATSPDDDDLYGGADNDMMDGGLGADLLNGGADKDNEGANQLTGNLGVDELRGGNGRDVLRAADGIRDRVIDCGGDTDADAQRDDIDPAAISCP